MARGHPDRARRRRPPRLRHRADGARAPRLWVPRRRPASDPRARLAGLPALPRCRAGPRPGPHHDAPGAARVVPPGGHRAPVRRGVLADEQGRRGPLRPVPRFRGEPRRSARRMSGPAANRLAGAETLPRADQAAATLLLGTISLDHYLASGDVLPGGGVLNMAWHWRRLGRPFRLLTRVGEDVAPIERFLARNGMEPVSPAELAASGRASAIDIEI